MSEPATELGSGITLERVLALARRLPPLEKIRLIERIAPEIAQDLRARTHPLKSLLGLCADLGRAPSEQDIDQARREVWADFPREDI